MGNADFHTIFDEELWILVFLRLRLFCCTSFFFFFGLFLAPFLACTPSEKLTIRSYLYRTPVTL